MTDIHKNSCSEIECLLILRLYHPKYSCVVFRPITTVSTVYITIYEKRELVRTTNIDKKIRIANRLFTADFTILFVNKFYRVEIYIFLFNIFLRDVIGFSITHLLLTIEPVSSHFLHSSPPYVWDTWWGVFFGLHFFCLSITLIFH